jgi:choice-of-anchor B domain-containing protein
MFSFASFFCFAQSSSNISLVGSLEFPNSQGNDIWGYVDDNGVEYALMGLTTGFAVVDLSDPSNPTQSFFIPGPNSIWRDIKVWNNYAFVTADQGNDGLLIVDLNDLSGSTYLYTNFDQNGDFICSKVHNIYIDENGKAYLFGGDVTSNGGLSILDVTSVSLQEDSIVLPTVLGVFDDFYLHDGMVRGDTLWGAAIDEGNFFVIDVSSPSNPIIFNDSLAFYPTPNEYTHNCWISDNGKTLFTTDEVSGAYIASYDVSDLNNISELDRIRSSNSIGTVIPHNVHVDGDLLVSSYYRDGIVVHDAKYPYNLIEIGHYDAYSEGGDGFDGSWGAYPYLPSGLILSSEINSSDNGFAQLLVLQPEYTSACYLEGTIIDSISGFPIDQASVRILSSSVISTNANVLGYYMTGQAQSGVFDVEYDAIGYFADTLQINLVNGELIVKDVALLPEKSFSKNGRVVDSDSLGIAQANIRLFNGFVFYELITNNDGYFFVDTLFQSNNYNLMSAKWGYSSYCNSEFAINDDDSEILIVLENGYEDDFSFDLGWEVTGNASQGVWEIAAPFGIIDDNQYITPFTDIDSDCYSQSYITGNSVGDVGADDVDNGATILSSPFFDISTYQRAVIEFHQWFVNFGGWSESNDSLVVSITNDVDTVVLDVVIAQFDNFWNKRTYTDLNMYNLGDSLKLIIKTADYQPENHLLEAGLDGFKIFENPSSVYVESISKQSNLLVYPNPADQFIYTNKSGLKTIYNLIGNKIISSENNKIDVSKLSSGVYILVNKNSRTKFVKE